MSRASGSPRTALTDDRWTRVRRILTEARDRRVFSAASWAVGDATGSTASGWCGTRAWPELPQVVAERVDASQLDGTERYDLASLTKPLVAMAAMALVERGLITDATTVGAMLPDFRAAAVAEATVGQLLLHTSGLPGQIPLFRRHPDRGSMLRALRELPLLSRPGTRVTYSSQGSILLGLMLEQASGLSLDTLVDELVAKPAGAARLGYLSGTGDGPTVATELCPWRGRVVQGQVHDENAVVLEQPAGHAGLFGGIDDLAAVGAALVRNIDETVLVDAATFAMMRREGTVGLAVARCRGWQLASRGLAGAGELHGRHTIGHFGFTGTSLFVDPDARRWFVLLTNRVHPGRDATGITEVRTTFHNVTAGSDRAS